MSEYKVLINSVKGLRKLVPYNNDFYLSTIETLKNAKKEAYESLYIYNDAHLKQLNETGSLSGIDDVLTDKVVFDFDNKDNPDLALADARTLVKRLMQDNFKEEEIACYFSSNKGLHVEVPLNDKIPREQFEDIVESYAGDLATFDTTVKDQQRVFRLPFSYNTKSGLYKFPMTASSLLDETTSISDMKEYAVNPNVQDGIDVLNSITRTNTKFKVKKAKKKEVTHSDNLIGAEATEGPDFSKNKTGLTHAKYALASGFFEAGERHEAVIILAATYRSLGWPLENAYRNIKATIAQRNKRIGVQSTEDQKEELWKEVSSIYSPLWKGGNFSEDTNALLIKTKKRYGIQERHEGNLIVSLSHVDSIFSDFAENIDKNTLKLGIPSFDEHVRITTSTLVSLLAAPSVGKSSISFGILNSTSREGIKSMFFSLDMGAPQVYQRIAQRHLGITSDKLFQAYQKRDTKTIETVRKTMAEEYSNVKFCFKGAMNVEIIREAILREKESTGEYPKLVVIDYLENVMTGLSNDPTIAKGFVARTLKDMANEFAICILLLVQPAKVSGGPSEELNSYYGIKGSSLVAEASAQVITMHRPGFNPKDSQDDNYLNLTVVKNRMGQLGSFDYHWTGLTGSIRELMEDERKTLDALRSAIRMEKAEGGDGLNSTGFKKFGSGRGDAY